MQVKGTGVANTCPTLDSGSSNIKDLKAGTYALGKFCMEPTSFTVKEESQVGGCCAPQGFASGALSLPQACQQQPDLVGGPTPGVSQREMCGAPASLPLPSRYPLPHLMPLYHALLPACLPACSSRAATLTL